MILAAVQIKKGKEIERTNGEGDTETNQRKWNEGETFTINQ